MRITVRIFLYNQARNETKKMFKERFIYVHKHTSLCTLLSFCVPHMRYPHYSDNTRGCVKFVSSCVPACFSHSTHWTHTRILCIEPISWQYLILQDFLDNTSFCKTFWTIPHFTRLFGSDKF